MSKDIFLCHSSDDGDTAMDICSGLEDWDIDVWIAPRDEPEGGEWANYIMEAISSCHGLVFLSSESAYESKNTIRELSNAGKKEKPIIPVLIDETEPPDEFRFYFNHVQWIKVDIPPTDADHQTIADAVGTRCPKIEPSEPSAGAVDRQLSDAVRELTENRDSVTADLVEVLHEYVGYVPADLSERSEEFVEDLSQSLKRLENEYVIIFSQSGMERTQLIGNTQTEAMVKAAEYLIRHHDLINQLESIPWVPGRRKAIINDSPKWEEGDCRYRQLDSGWYLDTKLNRKDKKTQLRAMAARCDIYVEFTGQW